MGCNCGGSKRVASERLAARRAERTAAKPMQGGVSDPRSFWNGPKPAVTKTKK